MPEPDDFPGQDTAHRNAPRNDRRSERECLYRNGGLRMYSRRPSHGECGAHENEEVRGPPHGLRELAERGVLQSLQRRQPDAAKSGERNGKQPERDAGAQRSIR